MAVLVLALRAEVVMVGAALPEPQAARFATIASVMSRQTDLARRITLAPGASWRVWSLRPRLGPCSGVTPGPGAAAPDTSGYLGLVCVGLPTYSQGVGRRSGIFLLCVCALGA